MAAINLTNGTDWHFHFLFLFVYFNFQWFSSLSLSITLFIIFCANTAATDLVWQMAQTGTFTFYFCLFTLTFSDFSSLSLSITLFVIFLCKYGSNRPCLTNSTDWHFHSLFLFFFSLQLSVIFSSLLLSLNILLLFSVQIWQQRPLSDKWPAQTATFDPVCSRSTLYNALMCCPTFAQLYYFCHFWGKIRTKWVPHVLPNTIFAQLYHFCHFWEK